MPTYERRLTKKGQTRWRAKIRRAGYPALSKTFASKAQARHWASQTESSLYSEYGISVWHCRKRTMADAIDLYIKDVLPRYGQTGQARAQHLHWWRKHVGQVPIYKVSPALIMRCRDILSKDMTVRGTVRAPATVNRYMASLAHVFTILIKEWGWIERSPFANITALKEPPGRTRCLSKAERDRLLEACRHSSSRALYPAVVLALSTAARKMEIMRLRWGDIDLQTGRLTFQHTKNGERRVVPLQGYALSMLRQRPRGRDDELLFPGKADPSRPVSLRSAWEKALETAAVNNFRWHDLRHSSASYLAMNGATLLELSQVLGHKTLSMVKRYAHLSENHTARLVADMNRQIFKTEDKTYGAGQKRSPNTESYV